jgi:hypothetical protein
MAHQSMQVDGTLSVRGDNAAEPTAPLLDWIEVDKDYAWYINEKLRVVEEEGKRAVDSLPENDEAAGELLDTVIDHITKVRAQLWVEHV